METTTTVQLLEASKKRILIIDGAMGTMVQKHHLSEADFKGHQFKQHSLDLKGNNDLLSITQPQIILDIHRKYLEAGADIIETNTFSATTIAQADYKLQEFVYQINYESAKLAKQAAIEFSTPDKPRFVAGALGPTNRTGSISPDVNRPEYRAVTFDDLANAYYQQAKALLAGGADILLVETVFDTLNCKAALYAIQTLFEELHIEVPVMVSFTIVDASGRTLSGQTVEAFLNSVSHVPLFSIGINCALGAKQMRAYISELSEISPFKISCYPNAGLPNAFGGYDEKAETMANDLKEFAKSGFLNIVGGCCGTTPQHIKAIANAVKIYPPHKVPPIKYYV